MSFKNIDGNVYEYFTTHSGGSGKKQIGLVNQYYIKEETTVATTYQWQVFNFDEGYYEDDTTNTTLIQGVIPVNGQAVVPKPKTATN